MTVRESIAQLRQAKRAFAQAPTPALSTSINQLVASIRREARSMRYEARLGLHWQVWTPDETICVPCMEAGSPPGWLVTGVAVRLKESRHLRRYFFDLLNEQAGEALTHDAAEVGSKYGYIGRYVSTKNSDATSWHFDAREATLRKILSNYYGDPAP